MRNKASLSKHLLCVIVRKCVYTVRFSALQTKGLFFSKSGRSGLKPTSTHLRTITHDSYAGAKTWLPSRGFMGAVSSIPERSLPATRPKLPTAAEVATARS